MARASRAGRRDAARHRRGRSDRDRVEPRGARGAAVVVRGGRADGRRVVPHGLGRGRRADARDRAVLGSARDPGARTADPGRASRRRAHAHEQGRCARSPGRRAGRRRGAAHGRAHVPWPRAAGLLQLAVRGAAAARRTPARARDDAPRRGEPELRGRTGRARDRCARADHRRAAGGRRSGAAHARSSPARPRYPAGRVSGSSRSVVVCP